MYKITLLLILTFLPALAVLPGQDIDTFREKNTSIFDIQELNQINNVEYKISKLSQSNKADDTKLIEGLLKKRNALIKDFVDDIAFGRLNIAGKDYRQEIEALNAKIEKNKKKRNKVLQFANLIKVDSLKLNVALQVFIKKIYTNLRDFKKKSEFEDIFTDFREELLFNLKPFEDLYGELSEKEVKTKDDIEFIKAYDSYKKKTELYQIIFYTLKEYVNRVLQANLVLDYFNIEYFINYLNSMPHLTLINASLVSTFSVSIGQLLTAIVVFALLIILRNPIIPYLLNLLEKLLYGAKKKTSDILKEHHRGKTFSRYLRESLYIPFGYILFVAAFDIALRILLISRDNVQLVHYFEIAYVILIVWGLFRLLNNFVYFYSGMFLKKYPNVRGEMINFFVNFSKVVIVTFFILLELHNAGFNITGILASLGIGGLAVALAARDTLTNIFGSISIIMDNMFSQGDWIATERAEGTVVDIGMRTTKIRTFDNAMIFIPNSYLANTDIKNWHKRKLGRRIKMSVGVTYSSKMEDVLSAVDQIHDMLEKHPGIANKNMDFDYTQEQVVKIIKKEDEFGVKKTLLVFLDEFAASSMNILVYCFTKTVDWEEWLTTKQDVMVQIAKILEDNNLEFAFPSQSVYFKNEGGEPFKLEREIPKS